METKKHNEPRARHARQNQKEAKVQSSVMSPSPQTEFLLWAARLFRRCSVHSVPMDLMDVCCLHFFSIENSDGSAETENYKIPHLFPDSEIFLAFRKKKFREKPRPPTPPTLSFNPGFGVSGILLFEILAVEGN